MRQAVDSLISAIGGLLFAEISSLWLPAWAGWPVRIVAGLHCLPFRDAFGTALSDRLGGVLFGLGILGGALVLRWSPAYSPWTGVAAGLLLLGFAAATARVRDTKTPTGGRVGAR
jgi:uncharacterized membrane protein YccC